MSKSPRRLITSISNSLSTTAEYLSMKRHGFGHDPQDLALFDRFSSSLEAQSAFNAVLHECSERKKKQLVSEVAMVDALNTLALRDGGNAAAIRLAARRQRAVGRLEQWMLGYQTVVGTSDELVKEMGGLNKRIEQLHKQVAELEAHRKGAKENVTALEKQYEASRSELVAQVGAMLKKKDEMTTRWMEKMLVCDSRLNDDEE